MEKIEAILEESVYFLVEHTMFMFYSLPLIIYIKEKPEIESLVFCSVYLCVYLSTRVFGIWFEYHRTILGIK